MSDRIDEDAEESHEKHADELSVEEQVKQDLIQRFLTPSNRLPTHWLPHWQEQWPIEIDTKSLYFAEPAKPTTTLEFHSAGLRGRITGYREITKAASAYRSALGSTSMNRDPAAYDTKSFVRGKSGQFPFAPGGLDSEAVVGATDDTERALEDIVEGLESSNALGRGGIRTIPPGFERGLDFDTAAGEDDLLADGQQPKIEPLYRPASGAQRKAPQQASRHRGLESEVEKLLPTHRLQMPATTTTARRRPAISKKEWAHVVDVNNELLNFRELVPDMAREYPFELDTFQKEAVYHLELGESVFIAAHTSAGKTVVAEYAIALAARHMTRAIYTSPIKALSNQKYRDFKETFGAENVGILTGDVQINPEASCLIMTTEILRSMLYKGADLIRDVEWVIFDEVHYVNDLERGVVWEEVIIMLPDHIGIILLSATVPNTKEFADWVGRTKKKDIYVISTPKRPVPLEHHLYAGKEIFKIVDSRGQFLNQGYKDAGEALKRKQEKEREAAGLGPLVRQGDKAARGRGGQQQLGGRGGQGRGGQQGQRGGAPANRGRGTPAVANAAVRGAGTFTPLKGGMRAMGAQDKQLWVHLVGELRKRELLPVVVFAFSKKKCEEYADTLTNTDLCTAKEKSEVHIVIERSITRLKGTDKKLPQILKMRTLLSRGIGVHHGGLLPIVKEMVELLFSRGLVKVLFATETFAMGVNMPARTVVFSGTRKHDGRNFRDLLAGEYTQMSGRAGRRGLDKTGVVIIVCNENEPPDVATLHTMILGQPTKLSSQFRLTYTMILNLLRVEALRVEEMIKRSFSENASQRVLPEHQKRILESEKELAALPKLGQSEQLDQLRRFYDLSLRLVQINETFLSTVATSSLVNKVFCPGRVVLLANPPYRGSLAVILRNAPSMPVLGVDNEQQRAFWIVVYTLDRLDSDTSVPSGSEPPYWLPEVLQYSSEAQTIVQALPLSSIALVTNVLQKFDHSGVADGTSPVPDQQIQEVPRLASELQSDPLKMEVDVGKLRAIEFVELLQERRRLLGDKRRLDISAITNFDEQYRMLHGYRVLEDKVANLRLSISEQNLELLPDYNQRIMVLQDLGFIDDKATVLLKGRVACEINTGHELILTELILDNFLAGYEPEEVVALLSSFVFQERRSDVEPQLTPRLQEGRDSIQELAERVSAIQTERRADVAENSAESNNLNFGLCEVVYEWAKGMPFDEITRLTDVQEGTIVRSITRLDETCREVRDAARVVGDAALYQKMEACQACIKRDIVFCASLYL